MTRRLATALIVCLVATGCHRRRTVSGVTALWFGGDVHLGGGLPRLFAQPPAALRGAVGVVNLEGALVEGAASASASRLTSRSAALPTLRAAGVGVVTLANNHDRDLGDQAPAHTAWLARHAGLRAAGTDDRSPVVTVGRYRVVILAVDLTSGVPATLDATLRTARRRGDILAVAYHVQAPPLYLPTPTLRGAVDHALAAGARIVVAHGTHTLGPVERRGDAVIAWGLGNLVFQCECTRETEGMLLRVDVGASGNLRAAVIPVEAGLDGAPARLPADPGATYDLLGAMNETPLQRHGALAWF